MVRTYYFEFLGFAEKDITFLNSNVLNLLQMACLEVVPRRSFDAFMSVMILNMRFRSLTFKSRSNNCISVPFLDVFWSPFLIFIQTGPPFSFGLSHWYMRNSALGLLHLMFI